MKKIPSLFRRDFENNPRLVLPVYNDGIEWVLNGEGIAFRKWDGTAVLYRGGDLYKRYDAKHGKVPPEGFFPCQDPDPETGHWPGWIICDRNDKADKWIWEAYDNTISTAPYSLFHGTYEAIGPKINGNKDNFEKHYLMRHTSVMWDNVPVFYDKLSEWLGGMNIEGIVWHHKSGDGRMCKIKRSDFGYKW